MEKQEDCLLETKYRMDQGLKMESMLTSSALTRGSYASRVGQ